MSCMRYSNISVAKSQELKIESTKRKHKVKKIKVNHQKVMNMLIAIKNDDI